MFLIQMDKDASTQAQTRVCGFLMNDSFGFIADTVNSVGAFAVVSSTRVLCAAPSAVAFKDAVASFFASWSMMQIDLDFSLTSLGNPIAFNGEVFFPGAAAKVYDGKNVVENGFYVRPDRPTLTQNTSGSILPLLSSIKFVAVYSQISNTGRLWRSAPSAVGSITLTGSNDRVVVTVKNLRVTDREQQWQPAIGVIASRVKIEIYATKPNEEIFFLHSVINNDPTADTQTVNYDSAIAGSTEVLYTQSAELPNEYPPAVLSLCLHGSRLFAASGDGTVWHTKETEEGEAAASATNFRIPFDSADGALVAMASLDTGLLVAKRSKLFLVTGQGPTPDGNSPYQFPIPLPAQVGFIGPRAFAPIDDGILFKSAKGMYLLSRGATVMPVEGADAYDSLTVTGAVALDDRPFVVFSTSNGSSIVYDWQFKTWYVWTGQAANNCARWQNQLVFLQSDGTVQKEVVAQYNDNGSAIASKCNIGFINMGDTFANYRLYSVALMLEIMASHTLSVTLSYDDDTSNADAARTKAATTADKGVFMIRPGQRRSQSVYVSITESSTTEGFRLSSIGLEVGPKPGMRKQASGKFLT
jgi:hypothetical protein